MGNSGQSNSKLPYLSEISTESPDLREFKERRHSLLMSNMTNNTPVQSPHFNGMISPINENTNLNDT